jgi:hypothetical protein
MCPGNGELAFFPERRRRTATARSRPEPSNNRLAGSGTAAAVVAVNVDVFPKTETMSKFPNVVAKTLPALIKDVPEIGPIGPRRL